MEPDFAANDNNLANQPLVIEYLLRENGANTISLFS
jgi:hypothetical protein